MKSKIASLIASAGILLSVNPLSAADILYFTSSPGSWIGQGQTLTFTDPSQFSVSRYYNQGAYTDALQFSVGGYDLFLVGPNYTAPTAGLYPDATRWPFMGSGAGLSFDAPGRGDNTLTGEFNVLEADYDASGDILSFAVDFTQYDEGVAADWVSGSLRYNSTIPVPAPEPAGLAIIAVGLGVLTLSRALHPLKR
ncbi:MAG TPA: hypothetical protein VH280_13540 [Verrucomicrobiae bacterium]|jgi:hypothetical protein|nr:hypothetical protein [Verrucomicrobiae bacterium]